MHSVLVRQKVQDYAKWKAVFDKDAETARKPAGSKGGYVFRDADDPNIVSVLLKWDTPENLQKFLQFMQSGEMQEIFDAAGVVGPPLAVHVFGAAEETAI